MASSTTEKISIRMFHYQKRFSDRLLVFYFSYEMKNKFIPGFRFG